MSETAEKIVRSGEDMYSTYDVSESGYVRNVKWKPIADIYRDVRDHLVSLGTKDEPFIDEYFSLDYEYELGDQRNARWPGDDTWRIAVFAVTGSSEGHYVHVGVFSARENGPGYRNLMLAKTFRGMDHALEIAAAITKFMGA